MYIEIVIKAILFLWLLFCSWQDIRKKEISLLLIGIGFLLLFTGSLIQGELIVWERIGGLSLGAILILISKVTRGQIGIGDGLILCVTGVSLGFYINSILLTYALLLAAMFSVVYVIIRKVNRKSTIPFIPFVFVASLGVCIAR